MESDYMGVLQVCGMGVNIPIDYRWFSFYPLCGIYVHTHKYTTHTCMYIIHINICAHDFELFPGFPDGVKWRDKWQWGGERDRVRRHIEHYRTNKPFFLSDTHRFWLQGSWCFRWSCDDPVLVHRHFFSDDVSISGGSISSMVSCLHN